MWNAEDKDIVKKLIKYMLICSLTVVISQVLIYFVYYMDIIGSKWIGEGGEALHMLSMNVFGSVFWMAFIISILLKQYVSALDERSDYIIPMWVVFFVAFLANLGMLVFLLFI
ncbi:MAG: hypothetical protein HRT57_05160 [Crocinitomicaceae bacterium]|nr:hypothetical protein [Crocinitomicaceae bacterium]